MHGNRQNCLTVIENGYIKTYFLDDKLVWEIGRPSPNNIPDIQLRSTTVSRKHGRFQNIDGIWFYIDNNGKNGTIYNGRHITGGIGGRVKPITLKDKDIIIFGGGKEAVINNKTIWSIFTEKIFDENWRIEYTKGLDVLNLAGGGNCTRLSHPDIGTVIENEMGMAIYMGNITYLTGNVNIMM